MTRYKILLLFIIMPQAVILASDGDGGYAGAFLRMGLGARAKAMGDALTALPEGAAAGFYNPALLPHLRERQLMVSFGFLPLDRSMDFIGYAQSLQPKAKEGAKQKPLRAGFALGWVRAGVDKIDGRDSAGNQIGYFSNSEHAFFLSFALSPSPIFSLGISGKVLYNRFPKIAQDDAAITSQGFGIDVGAFLTPVSNLMIGAVIRDNMSKYTWNTDKLWERGTSTTYKFPKILRTAIAYRIPQQWLLLAVDYETSKEQNPRYHCGAEFSYRNIGAIRMGLDDGNPTFGIGLYSRLFDRNLTLSYAFITERDGPGNEHYFTWTFDLQR
jgi:hypothetical protein